MAEQNKENLAPKKVKKPNAYDEPFGNVITSPFDRSEAKSASPEAAVPAREEHRSAEDRPTPVVESTEKKEAPASKKEPASKKSNDNGTQEAPKAPRKPAAPKQKSETSPAKKEAADPIRSTTANPPKTVFTVNKKDKPKEESDLPRSAHAVHQIIPYLLIGLCVFVGLALILNLFCNWQNSLENPDDHWMGVV